MDRNRYMRWKYPAFLSCYIGLERLARFAKLNGHEMQLVLALAILVAGLIILVCLRESHNIAQFGELIRTAWTDEWRGKDRVGKCNRAGTIILFTTLGVFFLIREAHSLIRWHTESMTPMVCLFVLCVAFLVRSLDTLAKLETHKTL